jgi:hypothetical protein
MYSQAMASRYDESCSCDHVCVEKTPWEAWDAI